MARPRKLTPLDEMRQNLENQYNTVTEHLNKMEEYKQRQEELRAALNDWDRFARLMGGGSVLQQRKKPGPKPGMKRAAAEATPKRRRRRRKQVQATV